MSRGRGAVADVDLRRRIDLAVVAHQRGDVAGQMLKFAHARAARPVVDRRRAADRREQRVGRGVARAGDHQLDQLRARSGTRPAEPARPRGEPLARRPGSSAETRWSGSSGPGRRLRGRSRRWRSCWCWPSGSAGRRASPTSCPVERSIAATPMRPPEPSAICATRRASGLFVNRPRSRAARARRCRARCRTAPRAHPSACAVPVQALRRHGQRKTCGDDPEGGPESHDPMLTLTWFAEP